MIQFEDADLWRLVTKRPAIEPGPQNHVLPAAVGDGTLKGVFGVSTSDNDENTDRADFSQKAIPEEPTQRGHAKNHTQRWFEQPDGS
jgi:hypothetical protein